MNYCKNECDKKFVLCHTINGKIRFKKSAVKEGLPLDEDGKDTETGDWITVTSPDDLFKAGIDVDFEKIKGGESSSQFRWFTEAKIELYFLIFFVLILELRLQRYSTNTKRCPPEKSFWKL